MGRTSGERGPQGCSFPGVGTGRLEVPFIGAGLWQISSGNAFKASGKSHPAP